MAKLWGGRFAGETDEQMHAFNASLDFDVRLYAEDIEGSIAWARALVGADVLTPAEAEEIVAGLERVRSEFEKETFAFAPGDEDIHTAVERRLTELIGPVAGKLHTGRSRNDQVATDFRLWVLRALQHLESHTANLQAALVESAAAAPALPLPGYTHLQHAQPVTWGHWALSHFWPLERDRERIRQARARASVLPLGSAALAGTAYPIDREALAEALGFERISENSLDAVSDRDFAADFLYATALLGIHLSRLGEHLILFSSQEFRFVTLGDGYSTGSSLMPQKRNPDALELARGKAGRLLGNMVGLLATLKGLPSSYDKDLQEDKEPVFDSYDTLALALPVVAGAVATMTLRPERMAAVLDAGLLATDLADYLVGRGVPFREAHSLVGRAVQAAEEAGIALDALSPAALYALDSRFGQDEAALRAVFDVRAALARRSVPGGTAPAAVEKQLQQARALLR